MRKLLFTRLAFVAVSAFLSACASTGTRTATQGEGDCSDMLGVASGDYARIPAASPLPAMRRLAWLEGNYQSDYEPDRVVAEDRAKRWEGKIPEVNDTENYLQYLSVLDASGKHSEAERLIKQYLADKPNERRAIFLLGVHYLRIKKKDLAQYFFVQLEKDPKFPWKSLVYNNLGMLALNEKNRSLGVDYLERATKAQPPTAAPFVNLGALYLQSRSYADAEGLFRRGLDIDEEFEDAALGLGAALEGQGKFDQAHKVYADFLGSNSDSLSVLFNDAIILGNRLKQREQAAEMMLRYIQRGGKETAKAHEIIQTWR